MEEDRVMELLRHVKRLAQEYRALTGRPLGVTGEVAEYEAARLLNIELTPVRHAGYDAVRTTDSRRYQIKGRCVLPGSKSGLRLGAIDVAKEFDAVLLVLLDESFNAQTIFEADRPDVIAALTRPGSRSRNERHAMSVSLFRRIGRKVWDREGGAYGSNQTDAIHQSRINNRHTAE